MTRDAIGAIQHDDPGLLTAAGTCLLTDRYEFTMAASYLERRMDDRVVLELFLRGLPRHRHWVLTAGLGPALALVEALEFGERELAYLESLGFRRAFLDYLQGFRFSGDVDAMPEGTVAFAGEPILRLTAPRIEAQLVETLLLNQLNFQMALATKAARIVLAAGGGRPGAGMRVVDFSARRDHGVDAAMKAARCAAIAGAGGTSNLAAALRYGLRPVGTMAHSYVMSFGDELAAFRAFLEDAPDNAVVVVDTYDTVRGVRHAIAAAKSTGVTLAGVRLDSGDLLALSRAARALLDEAGLQQTVIVASGDLDEHKIARLVAAGAPIDLWGVGTELGTSRDSPTVSGVYKLVAESGPSGGLRPVWKCSPGKATVPGPKQVFRRVERETFCGDVIAEVGEPVDGHPLLEPKMRDGVRVRHESLDTLRARAAEQLGALPPGLLTLGDDVDEAYPVSWSSRLRARVAGAGPPMRTNSA